MLVSESFLVHIFIGTYICKSIFSGLTEFIYSAGSRQVRMAFAMWVTIVFLFQPNSSAFSSILERLQNSDTT